jgi:hypothetical protein
VADAVVNGDGPNGLVAANLLADRGWGERGARGARRRPAPAGPRGAAVAAGRGTSLDERGPRSAPLRPAAAAVQPHRGVFGPDAKRDRGAPGG